MHFGPQEGDYMYTIENVVLYLKNAVFKDLGCFIDLKLNFQTLCGVV